MHDGQVVGLATVGPIEALAPLPGEELRSLYVLQKMWGQGIGQLLLYHALGDRPASLWVFESNRRARRFYAQTGWRATGEVHIDKWTAIPEVRLVRNEFRRNISD